MKNLMLCFCLLVMQQSIIAQGTLALRANAFLQSLDGKLRSKAQYTFKDGERFNWHFVPRSRNGVSLRDLNADQKSAAYALLKESLSQQGYQKATDIILLEKILQRVEGRSDDDAYRDPGKYYFTIFGEPGAGPWGWRIEGHHLSMNFAASSGEIVSSTPSFLGANPGVVPVGNEKGKQTLKQETELAFALINALTEDQLKSARFSERALPEIITGNERKAEQLSPEGIKYTALTEAQKRSFLELLNVYIKNYELGFSNKLMDKIKKAGLENLSFAWAGSLKPESGHYYRIQGPTLLIEYDNTQNSANHVHTVVRDLTNDFAEDILHEHYVKDHK